MRDPFKPLWHFLVGSHESDYLRGLHQMRERYPDIYHHEKAFQPPSMRRQATKMGFLLMAAFVAWAWLAHFFGGKS